MNNHRPVWVVPHRSIADTLPCSPIMRYAESPGVVRPPSKITAHIGRSHSLHYQSKTSSDFILNTEPPTTLKVSITCTRRQNASSNFTSRPTMQKTRRSDYLAWFKLASQRTVLSTAHFPSLKENSLVSVITGPNPPLPSLNET